MVMVNYVTPLPRPLGQGLGDAQECRSFEYFQERTAADLSYPFASDFWSQYILRIAHSESAVRHAIISLAAVHENFQSSALESNANDDFARRHYSIAIEQLLRPPLIDESSPDSIRTGIALVACIVFAGIECVQGNFKSALSHIRSGLRIIHETTSRALSAALDLSIPWIQLQSMFNHLETQVFEMEGGFEPSTALTYNLQDLGTPALLTIPQIYDTLEQAQGGLENWYGQFGRYLWHLRALRETERFKHSKQHLNFVCSFQSWSAAFDMFCRNQDKALRSQHLRQGILILSIWQKALSIILTFDWDRLEVHYDLSMPVFASIVKLSESVWDMQMEAAGACLPTFCFTRGIVAPL
ncbi:MAG: hypothetical protein Q9227_002826 [Pyrenula ochraceoflavens]